MCPDLPHHATCARPGLCCCAPQFTKEGLLVREVMTLEQILDEKLEILALFRPVSAAVAQVRSRGAGFRV